MIHLIDPQEAEIVVGGDQYNCLVVVGLAEDDDGEPLSSIICRGTHGYGGGFQFMELGFEVQLIASNGEVFSTQHAHIVRQYLPDHIRREILPLVARCYAAILERFRPGFVYRSCAYPELPDAAMEKHHFLTRAVLGCGYYLYREGTDEDGHTYWFCGATD
ncbi:hypothetical protein ACVMIH_006878 [Bradyrhizobium sp. USDA 4503]